LKAPYLFVHLLFANLVVPSKAALTGNPKTGSEPDIHDETEYDEESQGQIIAARDTRKFSVFVCFAPLFWRVGEAAVGRHFLKVHDRSLPSLTPAWADGAGNVWSIDNLQPGRCLLHYVIRAEKGSPQPNSYWLGELL